MIYHQHLIESNECQLIPYGDIHLGDRAFNKESQDKLKANLEKTYKNPNARVILMGDIFNCSTRQSATSPYEQIHEQELDIGIQYFEKIAKQGKIIGALDGNHEERLMDFANFSIMNAFCKALNIPYLGTSVALELVVGKRNKLTRHGSVSYQVYAHHTSGGGGTLGSKVNRTDKLRELLVGADVYLGGHNHQLHSVRASHKLMDTKSKQIISRDQYIVGCGSYLEWNNSYAERKQLAPNHLGSPVITFKAGKRDIGVTI
jgi:hypothetical protein